MLQEVSVEDGLIIGLVRALRTLVEFGVGVTKGVVPH